MNEASFLRRLHTDLKTRGFFVMKFADASSQGYPDGFIAKNGKGMFYEGKFKEYRFVPDEIKSPFLFTNTKKKVQLMTMVKMDQNFFARYIVGFYVRGEVYVALVTAMEVFNLVEHGQKFSINTMRYSEFLELLERIMRYT